jgi:hypothetical protein
MQTSANPSKERVWTLYDSGVRSLKERLYREAEACLAEYLSREHRNPKSANRRARAHCLIALAILARTPPLSRSTAEIKQVVARLSNAKRLPLAQVLASLVQETFYETDGWNIPEDLQVVAQKASVGQLDRNDVEQVIRHLNGMFGPTWVQICRQAGVLGVDDRPPPVIESDRVDPWRRKGVPRYFAIIPPEPPDPPYVRAWTLTGTGVALAVLPCGGLYVTTKWYVGLTALVLLYAAATPFLFFGILTWHDVNDWRRRIRARNEAIAAAHPQPTEAQIDAWLQEDVDAAVQRGADRHRLDLDLGVKNAGLVIKPQVIVGISRLGGPHSAERLVRDPQAPSGYRLTVVRMPLARSRVGADGRLRSSHYHVLVVFLSERRLGVFECDVDLATRRRLAEASHSFSYDDVVTMSYRRLTSADGAESANVVVNRDGRSETIHGDNRFFLSLVNGHHIEVSTAIPKGIDSRRGSSIAWDNDQVQRSIERMVWALKDSRSA